MNQTNVQPFSDGYLLVDAAVCEHSGETAITSRDFHEELRQYVTAPLIRVGSERYWLEPEYAVPAETVAVPEPPDEGAPVLMAKDKTTERLLRSGEERTPEFLR